MDFNEKSRVLRRIVLGKFRAEVEYNGEVIPVVYSEPSQDILLEADWKYEQSYKTSIARGVLTKDEMYRKMIEDDLWSYDKEIELNTIEDKIKDLRKSLTTLEFQEKRKRGVKTQIDLMEKRLDELTQEKHQLDHMTAEGVAEKVKKKFIVSQVVDIDKDLLTNSSFLDRLTGEYYRNGFIPEKVIREIARSEPWRIQWVVSKNTGTPLFGHPLTEVTDTQYRLLMWTRVYDFAFEHTNPPPDYVINDDDEFDAWYEKAVREIQRDNEVKKHQGKATFGERMIPADREGAKRVYDLNNEAVRKTIKQREAVINKQGKVVEADLPDVKRELQMGANRMASQKIKGQK